MDLKLLESFIIVAEQNSFTRASEILGYSQSAISTQIKQLEKMIGATLFERVNHTVKLTAKGHEVLKLSHQMLQLESNMKKITKDELLTGSISIAMAASLCHELFCDTYPSFHRQYPGIQLKIITAQTEKMFEMAKKNEIDMIYTLDKPIYEKNYYNVTDQSVKVHFIASSNHPYAKEKNIPLEKLLQEPMILTEEGMSYRNLLEEHISKSHLTLNPFLEIGDTSLICHFVMEGLGISFLPDYVTEKYVADGDLCRLDVEDLEIEVFIQLLYHKDKWCSPEMQCVIDFLKDLVI